MEKDMTTGKPLPVILKFMLPLIIGNIFQQLYNMADTIIVGRYVGSNALAAVGSTGTVMFLTVGFSQGITAGFSVLTSQRFGAKDVDGVRRSVSNGIFLSLIFAVILTAASMLGMRPLLMLMNTPKDIFNDAYTYIMIINGGLIATIFYNLFSSYLRAVGDSQAPLIFLVFSAILNVILDLLFIIHFNMGVAGAGYATIPVARHLGNSLFDLYFPPCSYPDTPKETLETVFTGKPSAADYGHPHGSSVCHYRIWGHDHADCDQSVRF